MTNNQIGMTKLKTLENLNCVHCNDKCCKVRCAAYTMHTSHAVSSENLREEAIKWIKELQKEINAIMNDSILYQEKQHNVGYIEGQVIAFKYFFNLSDEDLK